MADRAVALWTSSLIIMCATWVSTVLGLIPRSRPISTEGMPWPIRALSCIVPARYFVASLQTLFLADDVWAVFLPNMLGMLAIGTVFFVIARNKTKKSLD